MRGSIVVLWLRRWRWVRHIVPGETWKDARNKSLLVAQLEKERRSRVRGLHLDLTKPRNTWIGQQPLGKRQPSKESRFGAGAGCSRSNRKVSWADHHGRPFCSNPPHPAVLSPPDAAPKAHDYTQRHVKVTSRDAGSPKRSGPLNYKEALLKFDYRPAGLPSWNRTPTKSSHT